MIKRLKKKYAMTKQGAKDYLKAVIACVFVNLSLYFPVGLLYTLVNDLINDKKINYTFYIIGILGSIIIILITNYFKYNLTFFTTYKESGKRRINLAETLRKLPLSFFNKKDVTDLTTVILGDCTTLEHNFSHIVPQFWGAIISTIIVSISTLFLNIKMAIAALWVFPITISIVLFSRKIQNFFTKKKKNADLECNDGIQECIETLKELKSMNAEKKYMKKLYEKIENVEQKALFAELGTAVFIIGCNLLLRLGIATTALVGSRLLLKNQIDVMTFFMFLIIVSRIYEPMSVTLTSLTVINSQKLNIDRMNEFNNYKVQEGRKKIEINNYDIEFKNVDFSYEKDEKILNNVSFIAKQGEVTALIGESGSGKTTISKLAARFWDIDKGKIFLGNQDISKVDPEILLKNYSIVFQDVTLFNNTIMENIRIGKPDATDEEVIKAAKTANCDDIIKKFEDGYNTLIGENGSKLSGGERQRISIARAILKDAPIILLDEATASLDAENETQIQEAISKLIKNKTVLIIAHRMRTVTNADKIIVLKEGKVCEEGRPEELLKKNSIFKKMVEKQKMSMTWNIK